MEWLYVVWRDCEVYSGVRTPSGCKVERKMVVMWDGEWLLCGERRGGGVECGVGRLVVTVWSVKWL